MASYFSSLKTSNLGSTLSTRFQTVRQALTSTAEKDDENDENLSHVSNVLRAYYVEKGRVFPPWLPPDPRAPPPQFAPPPQQMYGANYGNMNAYGGQQQQAQAGFQRPPGGGGRGGLSDLFDNTPSNNHPTHSQPASQSLRQRAVAGPRPSHISNNSSLTSQGGAAPSPASPSSPPRSMGRAARPLPSQRVGSYQTSGAAASANSFDRAGSNGSTASSGKDRLRARLQGGGRDSPAPPMGSSSLAGANRPWDSGGSADGFDGGFGGSGGGGGGGGSGGAGRRAGMMGAPPGGGLPSHPRGPRGLR